MARLPQEVSGRAAGVLAIVVAVASSQSKAHPNGKTEYIQVVYRYINNPKVVTGTLATTHTNVDNSRSRAVIGKATGTTGTDRQLQVD